MKAIAPNAYNKDLKLNERTPQNQATYVNWKGSQQTAKQDMTMIIVLMTFFCVLPGAFDFPLKAAVEVDGPAAGC